MAHKIKGINFTIYSIVFFSILSINFFALTIVSHFVNKEYNEVKNSVDNYILCTNASETINQVSRHMTEQAQLFIMTHDYKYVQAYLLEKYSNRRQEKALQGLLEVIKEEDESSQRLLIALQQSDSLSSIEMYAMRLAMEAIDDPYIPEQLRNITIRAKDLKDSPEEQQQQAENIIFGDGYLLYKKRVAENCLIIINTVGENLKDSMEQKSQNLKRDLKIHAATQGVLFLSSTLFFISIIFLILLPMKDFRHSIRRKERLNIIGAKEFKQFAYTYNEVHEFDPLTKVLNRRAFIELGNQYGHHPCDLALILIDVDDFKTINDSLGHAKGDTVLSSVATHLNQAFRKKDFVCRIGGDEFAVIVTDATPDISQSLKFKITMVNSKLKELNYDVPVSISAGIAFTDKGYSKELFENADKALYDAKNTKCSCCIFD